MRITHTCILVEFSSQAESSTSSCPVQVEPDRCPRVANVFKFLSRENLCSRVGVDYGQHIPTLERTGTNSCHNFVDGLTQIPFGWNLSNPGLFGFSLSFSSLVRFVFVAWSLSLLGMRGAIVSFLVIFFSSHLINIAANILSSF